MQRTTHAPPGDTDDQGRAPAPVPAPMLPQADEEARGCLFALSQPPLMLFLTVIGMLLGLCGVHDLLIL
jgi:hypothetical protein